MITKYIVYGTSGEYSERTEWAVVILNTEDEAKQYVLDVTAQYQQMPKEFMNEISERPDFFFHEEDVRAHMTLDPNIENSYGSIMYFYGAAPYVENYK